MYSPGFRGKSLGFEKQSLQLTVRFQS